MRVSIEKYRIRRIWLTWSRMGVCDWDWDCPYSSSYLLLDRLYNVVCISLI